MKKILNGLLCAVLCFGLVTPAHAEWLNVETIWNNVYNGSNAIKSTISGNAHLENVTVDTISVDTTMTISGDITMADDKRIGFGSGAGDGSIKFDQTPATDEIEVTRANLLINQTTTYGTNFESFEIAKSAAFGGLNLSNWSATNGNCEVIEYQKSGSDTIGTHTIVADGEALGYMLFKGSDGTNFDTAGYILFSVDGTPGAGTDMPGRIGFLTSPDGTATPVERMRINNSGGVILPTIKSGVTQALAGAVAGELYKCTSSDSIKIGV